RSARSVPWPKTDIGRPEPGTASVDGRARRRRRAGRSRTGLRGSSPDVPAGETGAGPRAPERSLARSLQRHRPRFPMAPETLVEQTQSVVRAVSDIVRTRDGRLVALTVTCPSALRLDRVVKMIEEELAEVGLDLVDVNTRNEPGPIRLLG